MLKTTTLVTGILSSARDIADDVYSRLGAGHHESIYRSAMAVRLGRVFSTRITVQEEVTCPVYFRGSCVGHGRADVVFRVIRDGRAGVIEIKTVDLEISGAHIAQCHAYCRAIGADGGAVINFPKSGGPLRYALVPVNDAASLIAPGMADDYGADEV